MSLQAQLRENSLQIVFSNTFHFVIKWTVTWERKKPSPLRACLHGELRQISVRCELMCRSRSALNLCVGALIQKENGLSSLWWQLNKSKARSLYPQISMQGLTCFNSCAFISHLWLIYLNFHERPNLQGLDKCVLHLTLNNCCSLQNQEWSAAYRTQTRSAFLGPEGASG